MTGKEDAALLQRWARMKEGYSERTVIDIRRMRRVYVPEVVLKQEAESRQLRKRE